MAITFTEFLDSIEHKQKKADARKIGAIMRRASGCRPKMYGSNVVGYGTYKYTLANGKEKESVLVGYSPRKQSMNIYIMPGFKPYGALMKKLGKHKHGSSCLYINKLADVDEAVLEELIAKSVKLMRKRYGA